MNVSLNRPARRSSSATAEPSAAVQADSPRASRASVDFSPEAVARAVMRRTLSQPYVLYPAAIGVLGTLAVALLGPALVFVVPAAAGAAVGLGGWALDYTLRRDRHAADYLQRLQAALAGRVDETLKTLRREFQEIDFQPGTDQIEALQDKFNAFEAVLRRKLNPNEMTFTRYLGMTEQVFLAGLDNLGRVSDTLRGLSAIDRTAVTQRLQHLHDDGIESAAQDREIAALTQRLELLERQQERVSHWLAENEAAMTQIDHAMAAIADLDSNRGHAAMDIESAMQELKRLADRAPAYQVDGPG